VQTVAECGDGLLAIDVIARERPDIVFLDIEMPGQDGLQLADAIRRTGQTAPGSGPIVVFTTAFSRYATDAFDVAATDYVLKPYSDERFLEALARAKRRILERRLASVAAELEQDEPTAAEPRPYLEELSFKQGGRPVVNKTADVTWIEAEDYYVMIHSTGGNHLIRASIASLEQWLDPGVFVRAHRAAIVNLGHVRQVSEREGLCLTLSDGSSVGVSRARKHQIAATLQSRGAL
jgi:two-component system LytT family response regulator